MDQWWLGSEGGAPYTPEWEALALVRWPRHREGLMAGCGGEVGVNWLEGGARVQVRVSL